jgi:O-antigen biosynthesis protein
VRGLRLTPGMRIPQVAETILPGEIDSGLTSGVVIVTHDLHPFGAQRVTVGLVDSLVQDFSTPCEVVSLGGGRLAVHLRRLAPVHNIGQTWKLPARDFEHLFHAIHRRGFRHAILNTVISGCAAPILRRLGFRLVGLVHEMPDLISAERLEQHLGWMLASTHAVVFPHWTVHERIVSTFPTLEVRAAIECIPQGLIRRNAWRGRTPEARISVRNSLGAAPEMPMVLGVGSGDTRKGVDLFIQCARIVNERIGIPCLFVWIGPVDDALRGRLVTQGILTDPTPSFIKLQGFLEDTAPYHSAADVFALTSREDPFPNVVLESMDAGVPVVAFAGSGGGAHLASTVAGRVVPAYDVDAFAKGVMDLLASPEQRASLGSASQAIVDREYVFRRYTERLLGLLQQPLCEPSPQCSSSNRRAVV